MSIEEKVNHIPGMVEPIEQKNLFNLAKNLELKGGDCLIEFGTFFGKSTFCISEGLLENKTFKWHARFNQKEINFFLFFFKRNLK